MKKINFLILLIFFSLIKLYSQITVYPNNFVGIGTTSTPAQMLTVNGSVQGNVNGALCINTGNGTFTMGPQNPGYCHMYTNTPAFIFNTPVAAMTGYFGSYYNSNLSFSTGITGSYPTGTVAMTIINSTGNVGIGWGYQGNSNLSGVYLHAYMLDLGCNSNSIIRAGNWVSPSDSTLKTNIKTIQNPTSSLLSLKGVSYNLKSNATTSTLTPNVTTSLSKTDTSKNTLQNNSVPSPYINRTHYGFLAQDVQKIYPHMVFTDNQGNMGIDYTEFIAILVEAVKEQNTTITSLQTTNTKLQSTVTSLQSTVTSLQAAVTALQKKVGIQ